jgi:ABC-type transporter Mla MlaB component
MVKDIWEVPAKSITLTTVRDVYLQGQSKIEAAVNQRHQLVFDLKRVAVFDSSIVALLLAWIKEAKAHKCPLALDHLKPKIKQIAELSDIKQLLVEHEL